MHNNSLGFCDTLSSRVSDMFGHHLVPLEAFAFVQPWILNMSSRKNTLLVLFNFLSRQALQSLLLLLGLCDGFSGSSFSLQSKRAEGPCFPALAPDITDQLFDQVLAVLHVWLLFQTRLEVLKGTLSEL